MRKNTKAVRLCAVNWPLIWFTQDCCSDLAFHEKPPWMLVSGIGISKKKWTNSSLVASKKERKPIK